MNRNFERLSSLLALLNKSVYKRFYSLQGLIIHSLNDFGADSVSMNTNIISLKPVFDMNEHFAEVLIVSSPSRIALLTMSHFNRKDLWLIGVKKESFIRGFTQTSVQIELSRKRKTNLNKLWIRYFGIVTDARSVEFVRQNISKRKFAN
ncbi:hypothetical protein RCL_jg18283.t1 [Rhizophagus clarus]|uniref:Uncharacterized protein n=1 Tax=Rhizophagus clarus TaxID=94130 RepID=A0A8H3QMA2_9GLOM|nr:hypothetical protein RCL_jg18283.t1 [Rhizophagus clarus]